MAVWNETTTTQIFATRRIDAEFSQPHYVEAEKRTRICNAENLGKLGSFVPGPFGSAFRVRNYDLQSSYRYIRGQDVKPFFILEEDSRFIPEADFIRLKHYAVEENDVMISVVGTLGNVAVCTARETPAMFSCKSTLFRSAGIDPYYLLAYLNSKDGQLCLLRRQRGAIQMGLNIEDLNTIPIPRFGESAEREIAELVRKAHGALVLSRDSHQSAQQLLRAELGLDKLKFAKSLAYVTNASEIAKSYRTDAEFYNPEAKKIVALIESKSHTLLGQSFTVDGGFPWKSSRFLEDDRGEPVVRIRNIRPSHINPKELTSIPLEYARIAGVSKAAARDIVIGMDGIRYFYASMLIGPCYVNQRVAHLALKSAAIISPEFATFIINSPLGQAQLMRDMTVATTVGHITNRDIRRLVIPTVSQRFHDTITELVAQSISGIEASKRLIGEAKARVEKLIGEATKR